MPTVKQKISVRTVGGLKRNPVKRKRSLKKRAKGFVRTIEKDAKKIYRKVTRLGRNPVTKGRKIMGYDESGSVVGAYFVPTKSRGKTNVRKIKTLLKSQGAVRFTSTGDTHDYGSKITRLQRNPASRGMAKKFGIVAMLRNGAEMYFNGRGFEHGHGNAETFYGEKAVYGAMHSIKNRLPQQIVSIRRVRL